jgi:hypothetical protein
MVAVPTRPQFFEGSAVRNKEKNLLKALTNDCNSANINFKAIATQTSKKIKLRQRHPFQLEQYYQRKTEDFLVNNNISSEPTHDLKMLPKQENKLEEAVLRELVWIATEKFTISRDDAKKLLTEKTALGLPHKTLSIKQIKTLERKINNVCRDPRKFFKNEDVYKSDLIDWEKISVEVFSNNAGFDAGFSVSMVAVPPGPHLLKGTTYLFTL